MNIYKNEQEITNPEDIVNDITILIKKYGKNVLEQKLKEVLNENSIENFDENEPILDEKNQKLTAFPINYKNIWKQYKNQLACIWKPEEIDFSSDYADFMTLTAEEQHFIKMILAFFAASDGIVNFNLNERFTREVKITEAIFAYNFQMMMENIHCVSGDTNILTDIGYFPIEYLVDKNIFVWNGKQFSPTTVKFTGKSYLMRVVLSNGNYIDSTPEHKWYISESDNYVFTKDLKIGNTISNYSLPIIDNKMGENDLYYKSIVTQNNKESSMNIYYNMPINCNLKEKIEWIKKLFSSKKFSKDDCSFRSPYEYLRNLQLFFTTFGIMTTIKDNKLYFSNDNMNKLSLFGVKINDCMYSSYDTNLITVVDIYPLVGEHNTFCFNEPDEHKGIFNGILTGQSETYSLMLENIVKDDEEKNYLFNAVKTVPSVKLMADWAFKWIDSSASFAHRVVAFAVVEAVFFSGAFASIFWIKKYKTNQQGKGKPFMNGLISSNKFIARDEGLHCTFACELYKLLKNKLSTNEVNSIIKEAVKISQVFMTDALPVRLIGMNSEMMCDYIEYIGDRLLGMLGYKKIFEKKNPFKFMETIGLDDKTNFFEVRPTEYQDAYVLNESKEKKIKISDDF